MTQPNQVKIRDLFSYGTCIRTSVRDPKEPSRVYLVGNTTWYSMTTKLHQEVAGVERCDIQLDNVPRKATASDLRMRALAVLFDSFV